MTPTFVSPNGQQPIFKNWLFIARGDMRVIALKHGKELALRSTRHLRIVELTDPPSASADKLLKREVADICSEVTLPKSKAHSDTLCRNNLELVQAMLIPAAQWLLGKDSRLFALVGKSSGEGKVRAYDGKTPKAFLQVRVADSIPLDAAVHRVRHQPGGSKTFVTHPSKADDQAVVGTFLLTNEILRQAGVKMAAKTIDEVDVSTDLGGIVDVRSSTGPAVKAIRATGDGSVVPDIFLVGRLKNNSSSSGSTFDKEDVIIEADNPGLSANVLAHEIGHVLGLSHRHPDPNKTKRWVDAKGNKRQTDLPTRNLMGAGDYDGLDEPQVSTMRSKALFLAKKNSRKKR